MHVDKRLGLQKLTRRERGESIFTLQPSWGLGGGIDFLLAGSTTTTGEQANTYATLGLRRTFGGEVIVDATTDLGPAYLRLGADTWVLSPSVNPRIATAVTAGSMSATSYRQLV